MELSLAGVSVMLAMPTHRDIPTCTAISLLETQDLLWQKRIPFEVKLQVGSSLVHHARTKLAHLFLESDKSVLFWVDSDMQWKAEDFVRLCALSTKMDIVGAAYTAKQDPPIFLLDQSCTGEIASNEFGCLALGGWGMGFTAVNRRVIEALSAKAPKRKFSFTPEPIPYLFRCDDEINGSARGEDMSFFADAKEAGFGVFLDPTITLGHVGSKTYSASLADMLKPIGESNGTS